MKVGTAGGIEAFVKAINAHINNPSVCHAGCTALLNMAINGKIQAEQQNTMKRTAESQVKVGAAGGIEAVVKAINTHINNADVCKMGCGTLGSMGFNNGKKHNKNKVK